MRAVMLEVPDELLEDRRRKGLGKRDEVWAGVLHMVPPPAARHNLFGADLILVLHRIAGVRGLRVTYESGVFDPVEGLRDYRVPDLIVAAPEQFSERGIEGRATLVVELLSPDDESRDKLPFYARVGVEEVWLIDPVSRSIEVLSLRLDRFVAIAPRNNVITSPALAVELETVAGPTLRIRDGANLDDI